MISRPLLLFMVLFLFFSASVADAATFSGMIIAKRDSSRTIVSAILETNQRDGSGSPVTYNIAMDENGMAIATQYENKDIKIEGTLRGRDIVAETWQEIRQPAPAYVPEPEPEPEPEPSEDEEEPKEESDDDEPKDEEEPKEESDDDEY